jgi:glycosyltransferase involved in cell wall biosynthesis
VVNFFANQAVHLANHVAARASHRIVAYTRDYAENSPLISRYLDKVEVIPPPVEIFDRDPALVNSMQSRRKRSDGPLIGMAARLATEKGVEYLLDALPEVIQRFPDAEVFFAGQHEDVLGEAAYAASLESQLNQLQDHWTFLGVLSESEMRAFYELCDVTVLPSINSTESFGLVQIESMMCGTPVVASNLPGVRQPVRMTGMGVVVPIQDGEALAQALVRVLEAPNEFIQEREEIERPFKPDSVAGMYEDLFQRLQTELLSEPSDA